jgi:biopolymer transport protein TolR
MSHAAAHAKPFINVTPLIDVLLVMLIIFMVAAPLKPHSFFTKLPSQQNAIDLVINDKMLVVSIAPDRTLKLNQLATDMGTIDEPAKLSNFLIALFRERQTNRVYRADMISRPEVPERYRIEKTVFIKAPRSIAYGEVAKVIDELKGAGAEPVGLQLDSLQ